MADVALIGADGAGKTTVARLLEAESAVPVAYIYLGVNAEASNQLLPTTRLLRWLKRRRNVVEDHGPPPAAATATADWRGVRRELKAAARLANRVAEEWYRLAVSARLQRRGVLVVYDRHYRADYVAHDMAGGVGLTWDRRLHGWLLRRYPEPDVVIFLDAEPEVLLARKGEGTIADLERRREDYRQVVATTHRSVTVDVSRPIDDVMAEVRAVVADLAGGAGSGRP